MIYFLLLSLKMKGLFTFLKFLTLLIGLHLGRWWKRTWWRNWISLKATLLRALCGAEFVSITTDFWTYLATVGITAHYITYILQLQSGVLQMSGMEKSHFWKYRQHSPKAVEEWKVEKLVATTMDNVWNIVKAVHTELQWQHVHCFAHTLQIGVRPGLDLLVVSGVIARYRKVVTFFRKIHVVQTVLRAKQSTYGLP